MNGSRSCVVSGGPSPIDDAYEMGHPTAFYDQSIIITAPALGHLRLA